MVDATMINPDTGDRQAVESGSQDAQTNFANGYQLETSYDEATGESTWDGQNEAPITPEAELDAPVEQVENGTATADEYGGRFDHISDPDKKAFAENQYKDSGSPDSFTINWDDFEKPKTDGDEFAEDIQQASDEQILIMEDYQDKLDALTKTSKIQNQAIIDDIKRTFDKRKRAMDIINKATLGSQKVAGARAGRQRYATEIQTSIVSSEESAGIQRLADLDAQELSLINQAEMAATEKDFERLNESYKLAMDISAKKEETLLQLRQLALDEEDRMMTKVRFNREKATWAKEDASARLESMMTSGIDIGQLSDEEYTNLETDLGLMEGTLEGFYTGLQDAQAAQAVGDNIKLQKSVIDLLNSTPEGMEVTIGDSTYTGLKDMTDRMSYTEIVGNTKFEVMVDKKTGEEIWRKSAGQAYKPSSGSKDTSEKDYAKSASEEANRLKIALDKGAIDWAYAFDSFKTQYPELSNEDVNEALGGSVEYDEESGAFGESKGRASETNN